VFRRSQGSAVHCWATVCKTVLVCKTVRPVCDVGVLWPNGWTDQDESWHGGRPRPRPHCVRWIKIPLGTEVTLGPGNVVVDGDPAPLRKGTQQPRPHFSAHVCLLWPNCGPSQQLLSSCSLRRYRQEADPLVTAAYSYIFAICFVQITLGYHARRVRRQSAMNSSWMCRWVRSLTRQRLNVSARNCLSFVW